ncbi:hypothetical protein [Pseudoalteromonas umbrosa]|uniref:hypothetical protein n=1 Tax=Pseudoalteromonas umbrosa TaxID=3048489 RepID=UPI0024C3A5AE|nr:hypothetical protein [Pseudoalteromonas sp. B95]MDK1289778.1 hypothetical protein [Pseudoalteromonas sp. B95]
MSKKSVSDLIVKLKADSSEYSAGIRAAINDSNQFARRASASMTTTKSSVTALTGAIAGLGLGLSGAAIGMISLVADNAAAVVEMDRMAQSLEVNTTRFDKMAFAARQYGVDQEEFAQLLSDTSERITELVTIGTGEALDMFEQLNISVDEFKSLKPDEMFLKMMESLSALSSQQERNLYLQQIGGDAAQALSEIAEDGAASFIELAESMDQYGGALSESAIVESKELNEQLRRISETGGITLRNSLVSLTPVVKELGEYFADWSKEVSHIFDTMRDNPLTDLGLADKITDDQNEIASLTKELERLQEKKKFGFDWGYFATNQDAIKQVEEKLASLNKRLESNLATYQKQVFGREITGEDIPDTTPDESTVKGQGGEGAVGTGFVKPVGVATDVNSDQAAKNLERLRAHLATRLEVEQAAFARSVEWLEQAKDAELITDTEYKQLEIQLELSHEQRKAQIEEAAEAQRIARINEARQLEDQSRRDKYAQEIAELQGFLDRKSAMEAEHEDRKRNIQLRGTGQYGQMVKEFVEFDRASGAQRLNIATSIGKSITAEAATHSKKAFRLHQMMSIGNAMISTFTAATKALELGPIIGPIAAAAITTMGIANVAQIKSQPMPQGMAHEGIEHIPREGTWLLDKGERVYTNQSAKRLDRMADQVAGMANQEGRTAGRSPVNLQFNIDSVDHSWVDAWYSEKFPDILRDIQGYIDFPN